MTTESEIIAAVAKEFGAAVEYRRPPYGRAIRGELAALHAQAEAGRSYAVLVPARTDTRWMWDYCRPWEVRFLRGRVRFDGHRGGAPFPSALVVMGPTARRGEVIHWEKPW